MKTQKLERNDGLPIPYLASNAIKALLRSLAGLLLLAGLLASATAARAATPGIGGKRGVDTMQVNLYVGGGIERILALDPTDPGYPTNLIATVTGIYYEIVASQPPIRMQGVADQIKARMPDLVSVEEASLLRVESPGDLIYGGTNLATHVVYDYLQLLVDALKARGAHYAVASISDEIDVELPMMNLQTGTIDDARLTDREAILVRTDLPPGQFRATHPQSGHFTNVIAIPGTGFSVLRGWCSVDVFVRGQNLRYVCVHLEDEAAPQIQILQANELLAGPANVNLPVLLVGDFNADPFGRDGSLAYGLFPAAGFTDTWAALHPNDLTSGLTWGHDEYLADPSVLFNRRIDFVFFRGAGFVPMQANVVDMRLARLAPPFWASDHAALAVQLDVQRAPLAKAKAAVTKTSR